MRVQLSSFSANAGRQFAWVVAILVASACGDSTSPPTPTKYLLKASESSPIAGAQVLLKAQLLDAEDRPVASAGRTVTWIDGGTRGSFNPASSVTLEDGSASTLLTTSTVAGVAHKITAVDGDGIKGIAADITTVAGPGTVYTVTLSTQQPSVNTGVLITAQLTDAHNNVSKTGGRVVTWTSTGSGGSFSSATSTTNADGIATVTFTVGPIAGTPYTVSAMDDKFASGTGVLQPMAGAVAKYILSTSVIDPPAGAPIVIVAQAIDATGNPAEAQGQVITWTNTGSGGSFSSNTSVVQFGSASVNFTTGGIAGTTYSISAKDAAGIGGTSGDITTQPHLALAMIARGLGATSTCGIASDGSPWCWGGNDGGALGNGTTVDRSLAGRVTGNLSITSLSEGYSHACGVTTSGIVQCWGDNQMGQLGDNTMSARSVPGPIASSLTFTSVTTGHFHSCALSSAGDVYCWGSAANGRLGDGGQTSSGTKPVKVAGGFAFTSISSGGGHSCGVAASGAAYCWGLNASGELGDGSLVDRSIPVPVGGGVVFIAISAGESHTCGIAAGAAAYCWGDDKFGQLGFGTPTAVKMTPTLVAGGLSFATISAGAFHTCGITTNSAAWCWGDNSTGELGNPTGGLTPTQVIGGLLFKSIGAGGTSYSTDAYYYGPSISVVGHTCGLTMDGATYCWGSNSRGELGYGPGVTQVAVPLKVAGQL
jgi:alpha-tubulin suppressor-like RCC1 family protein